MKCKSSHILIIEVLSPSVDLILQGEVKGHMLHMLPVEHFGASCIVYCLEMADHVGKPNSQTIVAEESRAMDSDRAWDRTRQSRMKGTEGQPMTGPCSPPASSLSMPPFPRCCGSGWKNSESF